jgi:hypothetical protein
VGLFVCTQDRVGHDKTQKEIELFVNHHYLVNGDATVSLLTKSGQWSTRRHRLNDRGDESSIQARQKSVETVGILQELRGGPFLIKVADSSINDEYEVAHWATLLEGAQRAWQADTAKSNKAVQMSVVAGLQHCKVYMARAPDDVVQFLKATGNLLNSEVTQTTFLEVWRDTARVEAAWSRRKIAMGWTTTSLGPSAHDELKFGFVCGLLPRRFTRYRQYENCSYFFKEASKLMIPVDTSTTTDTSFILRSVWDILVDKCQAINTHQTQIHTCTHTYIYIYVYTYIYI